MMVLLKAFTVLVLASAALTTTTGPASADSPDPVATVTGLVPPTSGHPICC